MTYINIHARGLMRISAQWPGTSGHPLIITIEDSNGDFNEITLYTHSESLSRRLGEAINAAAKPDALEEVLDGAD